MDQEQYDLAVSDFVLSIGLLVRRIRAASGAHDLSLTQTAVLRRLDAEGPATISELARAESIKPQSMGAAIAELEERALVMRQPHPTDGRQVNIVLTSEGAALRAQIRAAKRTWLAEAMLHLNEEDREILFRAGEVIKRVVKL